jgi:hypothetical protein
MAFLGVSRKGAEAQKAGGKGEFIIVVQCWRWYDEGYGNKFAILAAGD